MTTTGSPRRRRPHPARRARKLTGYLSIAGMLMLTGCMAATTKTSTSTQSAAIATQTQSTTGATAATTARSTAVAAVAAGASVQPVTSSHGS